MPVVIIYNPEHAVNKASLRGFFILKSIDIRMFEWYIVFRTAYENGKQIIPLMLIKVIGNDNLIFKTFIVEDSITLIGALHEFEKCSIRLISPLENDYPNSFIKYKW